MRHLPIATPVFANFRYSIRQLRKHPSFTLTVLATLGLCIGANTAVFTIADSLFFRPAPFPEADRLATIATTQCSGGASETMTSQTGTQWQIVRDYATMLDSAAYSAQGGMNIYAGGHVEYAGAQRVSENFFHVLGVMPILGREFTREEDVPGGPPLAIISYDLWQRLFQGRRDILGRTFELGGAPYTVIGVAPRGFVAPSRSLVGDRISIQVWTPLRPTTNGEGSGSNYGIISRLKPSVTFAQANAQLNSIMRALFESAQRAGSAQEEAMPLTTAATLDIRRSIELMWAAVGVVLVIGCINIAGLLLARSASRNREVATRQALGGSRAAIVSELLAECFLLAVGGGFLGLLIGRYALEGLVQLNPGVFDIWGPLHLDLRVAVIMISISLLTSVLFGLLPALQTASVDLRSALSDAGRNTAGTRHRWRRQGLVFAEVALGVVLVVSATLLVRTFSALVTTDPGFDPHNVTVASASLQDARYKTTAAGVRLFRESIERIERIPGVESAAVALSPPYGRPVNDCMSRINGVALTKFCLTNLSYASPSMFETLHMKLLQGRLFTDGDTSESGLVAVINRAFVRHYLNRLDPIGSTVTIEHKDWRIIGVVSDVPERNSWGNQWGPIDTFPQVYIPVAQFPDGLFAMANVWFAPVWMVRTHGPISGLPEAMSRALASVDPRVPFSSFRSMEQITGRSVQEQRYRATILTVLAGLATLLAAMGVYGLIAESVTQRTREMGIRIALGASVSKVVQSAARPGILLSAGGVAAGLVLALFATRLLKSLIWGVNTSDPTTFAFVAVLLIAVAASASIIPALRLTHIDPAQTLRDE